MTVSGQSTGAGRPVLVTPYHKEDRPMLERCLDSVAAQTVPCDHVVVADGFPQDWIDARPVRHLKLSKAHADYGNTPRGLGALLAAHEGAAGIGFLDADNWLEPDHVERCLEAAKYAGPPIDVVIARRYLVRPNGTIIQYYRDPPANEFVDTNCFFLMPGAYHLIPVWIQMPKPIASMCDRIFLESIRAAGLNGVVVKKTTVYYYCLYEDVYRAIGETPPPNARKVDAKPIEDYLLNITPREHEEASRLVRFKLGGRKKKPGATA